MGETITCLLRIFLSQTSLKMNKIREKREKQKIKKLENEQEKRKKNKRERDRIYDMKRDLEPRTYAVNTDTILSKLGWQQG